ncbi:Endonuclease/exonuclease/phosphatase [Polychytrium aggregatum]|uniref:Endonuclease/exonuclease/phosphatase n=1 Tax=Polychytrium aggregatum TaxID=110093 RepID=UPI0022FE16FB|nr:Endonuclease/exonuclease/phosphatase [Polychytrium aggregatum]KAI9193320.1 Endonuclease/exonuclease/phosphatase [Polychytrium aggregatum]
MTKRNLKRKTDPSASSDAPAKKPKGKTAKSEPAAESPSVDPPATADAPAATPAPSDAKCAPNPNNTAMPEAYDIPETPDGKRKIVSYNMASYGSCVKKGFEAYLKAENADVFCVQETKLNEDPAKSVFDSLYPYRYWSHCTTKKGYSGVGIFSKEEPIEVTYGIGVKEFDLEGRVITAEFKEYFLINSYIPNAGSKLERLDFKTRYSAAMEKYLRELEAKKPVIWTGDLNVAHKEVDLARPATNHKTAGFTPTERSDFTRILSTKPELIDTYRHFHPDETGRYSYYSFRFDCRKKLLGWRLDYFVTSESLLPSIVDSNIRSEAYGASDHVPIYIIL